MQSAQNGSWFVKRLNECPGIILAIVSTAVVFLLLLLLLLLLTSDKEGSLNTPSYFSPLPKTMHKGLNTQRWREQKKKYSNTVLEAGKQRNKW